MAIGLTIIIMAGIVLLALIILGWIVGIYNGFIQLRNNIDKAWSNIDVLLKQRADELPKLIASVKGYMKHEKSLLAEITRARTQFLNARSMKQKAAADTLLTDALKSLFAVAENYPNLKANENFIQLQQELSAIEERIAYARQYYNDSILTYNNTVESFPGTMFARMFNKQEKQMLQITKEERAVPKVEF